MLGDSVVKWLKHQTSNLRIASRMGSNPVRDKPLFLSARNFTLIAEYWLVPGTDFESVFTSLWLPTQSN